MSLELRHLEAGLAEGPTSGIATGVRRAHQGDVEVERLSSVDADVMRPLVGLARPGRGGCSRDAGRRPVGTLDGGRRRLLPFLLVPVLVAFASCGGGARGVGSPSSTSPIGSSTTAAQFAGPPGELAYHGHAGAVVGVAWSPKGDLVASAGDDHTDQVWRPGDDGPLVEYREHHSYEFAVKWAPDATLVASVGADAVLRVWQGSNGATVTSIPLSSGQRYGIAWSPDGHRLAVGGDGGPATVWDAVTGAQVCVGRQQTGGTVGVDFSPSGRSFAAAGVDGSVDLYNATTCRVESSFAVGQPAWAVTFSPDGKLLAASTANITSPTGANQDGVLIWDLTSGGLKLRLPGDGPVNGVAWTPDGRRIVYGGGLLRNDEGDHDYRVWAADLAGRRKVVTESHRNTVWSVAVSPDGRFVAAAGQDGIVTVSPTPPLG